MPSTLSAPSFLVSCSCRLSDSGAVSASVSEKLSSTATVGSATGQLDRCISVAFSVTAGTPLAINVATHLDPLGNTAGMVHVSQIAANNDSTTATHDLVIGGGTNPVLGTDQYTLQANGTGFAIANESPGWTVTGGSADTITLTALVGTVTGIISITGRSA